MINSIDKIVSVGKNRLSSTGYWRPCKKSLDKNGVLVLDNFLCPDAIAAIKNEGEDNQDLAYYTSNTHNVYLQPTDPAFDSNHARNREVKSSKGCITTDQIPGDSVLRILYDSVEFREFLCAVLDVDTLYEYSDPLSSINLHYASEGQELGWHFDNSSFAITLAIQTPEQGGVFEYVRDVRDADCGEMNYPAVDKILNGETQTKTLTINDGTLVLFRGRNALHRVTPTIGSRTRMLVVLAYNTQSGIALSESARLTFYGRKN